MEPELRVPFSVYAAAPAALRYEDTPRSRLLRRISRGAACASAVFAIGALAGFYFEVRSLASLSPERATMKPISAVAVLLLSYAVYTLASPWRAGSRVLSTRIAVLLALLLASATLAERAFDWDLGIDELLMPDPWSMYPEAIPGRAAAATSVGIALLSLALLLASRGLAYTVAQALAIAASVIGGLALIGYVFGARALYAFQSYSQVGPSSAFSLVLLATGTLAAMPDRGLAGLASSSSVGGVLTRRLVPVAFSVPLLLAVCAQLATQRGLVRPELAMALFVVTSIAALTAVILHTAAWIHRLDQIRTRSEALLRASAGRVRHLSALVDAAGSAIVSFDAAGKVATWNARAERVFGRRASDAIGRRANEVFGLDPQRSLAGALEHVVRRGEVRRIDLQFETPRGESVAGTLVLSPLLDWSKRAVGACAVFEERRVPTALASAEADGGG